MRQGNSSACAGFTLVEVLTVVAIATILSGLLLPGVQKVREASRRVQCASNLREIALGVHRYQETTGYLPINRDGGYYAPNFGGTNNEKGQNWSWLAVTLPYLGHEKLYREANIPDNTIAASADAVATPIKLFLCPSDGHAAVGAHRSVYVGAHRNVYWSGMTWGISNYSGVGGGTNGWGDYKHDSTLISDPNFPKNHQLCNGDGPLWFNSWRWPIPLADITDGTSHTFMIGETTFLPWTIQAWAGASGGNNNLPCAIPLNVRTYGNGTPIDWDHDDMRDVCYYIGFRSYHPGGAQFAYVDGSLRFVCDSVDRQIYINTATIRGGELQTVD